MLNCSCKMYTKEVNYRSLIDIRIACQVNPFDPINRINHGSDDVYEGSKP